MINRLLSAFGIRKPCSSRHAETVRPQIGVITPEIEPYGLLSGHRPRSPEYVTDVTSHLNLKTREFLSSRFPKATYRVFLGLPPGAVGLDPEVPTIVAINPDGSYASYYLNSKYGLGGGHWTNQKLGSSEYFNDLALLSLMQSEVTEPTRQRIVEGFEAEMRRGDPYYRFPQHPRDETMFPSKYFRLVNTVVNGLPVQPELPLIFKPATK